MVARAMARVTDTGRDPHLCKRCPVDGMHRSPRANARPQRRFGSSAADRIPRRTCPITGDARVNSERWRCRIAWGRSGTASDQIDFDAAAACQMHDPDCGSRWQPVGPEILGVELVEGSVVALEVRKKYAHANNIFEPGAGA